jgi:SAM-dependent methyltransferase
MNRKNCLVCDSDDLEAIIDLGMQPFADTFIPAEKLNEPDLAFPLVCDICNNCGQIQTEAVTKPEDRYCSHDYSYTSSNSNFSRTHWADFAREVSEKVGLKPGDFVLEIGSNDGFLSEIFLERGQRVLGVDPSQYMAGLASQRRVKTIVGLFDRECAEKIAKAYGKPKLIVANNVFNHSNNPFDFARGVSEALDKDGTFVFELPYWYAGLKGGHVDQIYHEHVSYFTAKSSKALLERAGLRISSIGVVNYHGGSLRVFSRHASELEPSEEEIAMIAEEKRGRVFDPSTYRQLMARMTEQRNKFLQKVYDLKSKGEQILCVGAAAKGNTMLNFYNLGHGVIDYVTDSSPHKQGKYTPLTRIPIVGDEVFSKYGPVHAFILSWNISGQLKEALMRINPNINFISP